MLASAANSDPAALPFPELPAARPLERTDPLRWPRRIAFAVACFALPFLYLFLPSGHLREFLAGLVVHEAHVAIWITGHRNQWRRWQFGLRLLIYALCSIAGFELIVGIRQSAELPTHSCVEWLGYFLFQVLVHLPMCYLSGFSFLGSDHYHKRGFRIKLVATTRTFRCI